MPLLDSVSGMNRATKIVEVTNILDENAQEYLMTRDVTNSMAKRLVNFFGLSP